MHVILGATGHVGAVVAEELLRREQPVTVIVRTPSKAASLRARGAIVRSADVFDVDALREAMRDGTRLFLLNPPAPPSSDTDVEEHRSARAIVAALRGSGIRKVVALSTYGAREGTGIGDLGTLHVLERALYAQSIPVSVLRAAYYMSNWDLQLASVRSEGVLRSFFPVELALPMVAPLDLGRAAAALMMESEHATGLHHVEGPARYSANDVASELARVFGRPVTAAAIAPAQWHAALQGMGFSEPAAKSFEGMARVATTMGAPSLESVKRGVVTLASYLESRTRTEEGN